MKGKLAAVVAGIVLGSPAAVAAEKTVRTEAELRSALRHASPGTVIRLAPGRYELTQSLEINRGSNLQLRGPADGAPAVLSGSALLPSDRWQRTADPQILRRVISPDARARLVEYSLSREERRNLGQLTRRGFEANKFAATPAATLYFNGHPMTLARWPNRNTIPVAEVLDAGTRRSQGDAYYQKGGVFRVGTYRMARWAKADEIWIDGILGRDWQWTFNRVRRMYPKRGIVELRYGEVEGIRDEDWLHTGVRFVNLLEEIDEPGEYFIDRKRGRLYFYPPVSPKSTITTELSRLREPLLRVDRSSGIVLANLRLEGGRSHGLEIRDSAQVTVDRCSVRNFSGDGIRAGGRSIRIRNSTIEDVGACGIRLEGGDLRSLTSSGSVIEACRIARNACVDRVFNAAVSLEGAGHVVRGCSFSDLPHMALEFTGNDFLIEGNTFTRTSLRFRDMGAIYANLGANPEMRGTVIRNNLFHDIAPDGRSCGAIYLDNGTCGVTIARNAFLRVGGHEDSWAVMIHGGGEITVRENLFVECARPVHVAYWWNGFGKDSYALHFPQWKRTLPRLSRHQARYPDLAAFFESDRRLPQTNSLASNLIVNHDQPLAHGTIATAFQGSPDLLRQESNVFLSRDPGFADLAGSDLSLGPRAEVHGHLPFLKKLALPRRPAASTHPDA